MFDRNSSTGSEDNTQKQGYVNTKTDGISTKNNMSAIFQLIAHTQKSAGLGDMIMLGKELCP